MNEVLQWMVLVGLVILVLGTMRQVALTLPPRARAEPSGPVVGHRLPRRALAEFAHVLRVPDLREGAIIAFLIENCVGCQRLLATIGNAKTSLDGTPLVLVAKAPSPQFSSALQETGVPTISDEEGELWRACDVTATPLVIKLDHDGRVVAKEVTHRVDRVAAPSS